MRIATLIMCAAIGAAFAVKAKPHPKFIQTYTYSYVVTVTITEPLPSHDVKDLVESAMLSRFDDFDVSYDQ